MTRPIIFLGTTLDDLRKFPREARRDAGHQLDRVQNGEEPGDWKPLSRLGSGVCEIRIRDASGAYRVIYVARFPEAVYVLHAFQKKSEQTLRRDADLASQRFRDLMRTRP